MNGSRILLKENIFPINIFINGGKKILPGFSLIFETIFWMKRKWGNTFLSHTYTQPIGGHKLETPYGANEMRQSKCKSKLQCWKLNFDNINGARWRLNGRDKMEEVELCLSPTPSVLIFQRCCRNMMIKLDAAMSCKPQGSAGQRHDNNHHKKGEKST